MKNMVRRTTRVIATYFWGPVGLITYEYSLCEVQIARQSDS